MAFPCIYGHVADAYTITWSSKIPKHKKSNNAIKTEWGGHILWYIFFVSEEILTTMCVAFSWHNEVFSSTFCAKHVTRKAQNCLFLYHRGWHMLFNLRKYWTYVRKSVEPFGLQKRVYFVCISLPRYWFISWYTFELNVL